jgi:hypothetical protein
MRGVRKKKKKKFSKKKFFFFKKYIIGSLHYIYEFFNISLYECTKNTLFFTQILFNFNIPAHFNTFLHNTFLSIEYNENFRNILQHLGVVIVRDGS